MTAEIGQFALILALVCSIIQCVMPFYGSFSRSFSMVQIARPAAQLQFFFVAISYACLTWGFIDHDFSILYVANTSNTNLPLIYRISGVWGGHEGSILLWVLILAAWTYAVTVFNRSLPRILVGRVLSVLGAISIGFILFVLLTSNPFERLIPIPVDGASLNPLLQDPGMAIHPPMLYMGYVGFSVAFAFAIAALWGGQLDAATMRWMRPWTNIAWMFLTIGIALGSYWAYYELGWGGWWFWDPVENASFMPWLAGTALLHSLAASEKRGVFKAWTLLLAVSAFSLSLLGTFLVRSGVLTSVHSFAADPTRGLYILLFLLVVVGGSLLLFAFRAGRLTSNADYQYVSREGGILLNNVLMVVACASVLLGTLYPLFYTALGFGAMSVGPPYFNLVFVPLMLPVLAVVGMGATLNWKRDNLSKQKKAMIIAAIISFTVAVAFNLLPLSPMANEFRIGGFLALLLSVWVVASTVAGIVLRLRNRKNKLVAIGHTPASFWGMSLAHAGIAVFTLGVAITSLHSVQEDIRMVPGDTHDIAQYQFTLNSIDEVRGPNYSAARGVFDITTDGEPVTTLFAEKRVYDVRRESMTEAGIDGGFTRDLFVALGEPLGDGAWSVRLYYKPYIRWIWLGTLIMSLGALLAAVDKRYRLAVRKKVSATSGSMAKAS